MNLFEIGILNKISDIFKCGFLDAFMPIVTRFGDDGIFWIALAIILLCFKKTRKIGFCMGLSLIIGFLVGNVFLKNVIARTRPYDVNTEISLLISKLNDYSFPSGHTLASFESATAIFIFNKKWGIPALVLASLIAFSRIYLYVHYPTDVLGGIVLGISVANLSCYIINNLYLKADKKLAA